MPDSEIGNGATKTELYEEEVDDTVSVSSASSASSQRQSFRSSVLSSLQTLGSVLRFSAIQLIFPFINGMMLGFGEIFANEVGIRWGFLGAEV